MLYINIYPAIHHFDLSKTDGTVPWNVTGPFSIEKAILDFWQTVQ